MDLAYFLKERTALIRHFYDTAAAPFIETKRAIDAGDPPYDNPPYDESGEPAFLEEWLRADAELDLLGRACVSMLSEAVKHYLKGWERYVPLTDVAKKAMKPKGFVRAYMEHYCLQLGVDDCPDLDVIEQVVLARNTAQHGGYLTMTAVSHDDETRRKYPRPFFVRAGESDDMAEPAPGPALEPLDVFLADWLYIDRTLLWRAIEDVEQLGDWLQERIYR